MKKALMGLLCAGAMLSVASADAPGSYVAGIWVDPDGCQHWVMDLGVEGMMDSVLTRDGKPVCGQRCANLSSGSVFVGNSATVSTMGQANLRGVASQLAYVGKRGVTVVGNQPRANAVANVLMAYGIPVTGTKSSSRSSSVELICR